jgi:DnaJ-class molecular chaperone
MNTLYYEKKASSKIGASAEGANNVTADSQALQEIINILKNPFQMSCDSCNGLGFIRSGQQCPTCDGSGKVLDDCFK